MALYRQPIKLVDCEVHGAGSGAELFIVEGDSAAGAVEKMRDGQFQAVLPIQGKPLNAVKANEKAVRANLFLGAIIDAMGVEISEKFSLKDCRFDSIVLLCDPDADGIHCATLLLLFFHRWMKPLVDAQKLWMIRPPLMQIVGPSLPKPILAYSEEEGQLIIKKLDPDGKKEFSKQRFRGLASLPSDQLHRTCVDARTRRAELMTAQDADACRKLLMPSS